MLNFTLYDINLNNQRIHILDYLGLNLVTSGTFALFFACLGPKNDNTFTSIRLFYVRQIFDLAFFWRVYLHICIRIFDKLMAIVYNSNYSIKKSEGNYKITGIFPTESQYPISMNCTNSG